MDIMNINAINSFMFIGGFLIIAYAVFFFLEKRYHYLFLKEIQKEHKLFPGERYLFKKYNQEHLPFFSMILFASIITFSESFIPGYETSIFWEAGLAIITILFSLTMAFLAAFDYRMRLLPDTFIVILGFLSLMIFLYFLALNYETIPQHDFNDLLVKELWAKAIFILLPIVGFIAFHYNKLDMGFGDVKLLTALILLPYEWFNLSVIIFLTVLFAAIYIGVTKLMKSKMDSAPLATMCALAIPVSFLIHI